MAVKGVEQEQVWQMCNEMRSSCENVLKNRGTKEKIHPVKLAARILVSALLYPRKPDLDPYPRERILAFGKRRYVWGIIPGQDDRGYNINIPALVDTFTTIKGSVEKASEICFLVDGLNEHIVLGRGGAWIGMGQFGPDFEHKGVEFRIRSIKSSDAAYWQKKLVSFKPADIL